MQISIIVLFLGVLIGSGRWVHPDLSLSRIAGRTVLAAPLSPADSSAIRVGERLTYRISWSNFLEAGTAELSVGQGTPAVANSYRLQLKAISSLAISQLYSYRDEMISLFDAGLGAPTLFQKNFTERKRIVKENLTFDQINHSAVFDNGRGQSFTLPIEPNTQDPISALYALRGFALKPGFQVVLPVLDGGKRFQLEVRVTGSDLISTSLGSFNTHRVEASLRGDGIASADRRMTVWLTNDSRKIPVLASVYLPYGAALIELTAQSN